VQWTSLFSAFTYCSSWYLQLQIPKKFAEYCALFLMMCLILGTCLVISVECQQELLDLHSVTGCLPELFPLQMQPSEQNTILRDFRLPLRSSSAVFKIPLVCGHFNCWFPNLLCMKSSVPYLSEYIYFSFLCSLVH